MCSNTRNGSEAFASVGPAPLDSFEPASPLDIFSCALIGAGLPVRIRCYGVLILVPSGGPVLVGGQLTSLTVAAPFDQLSRSLTRDGRNTAIIAGQNSCGLPHHEDVAGQVAHLDDVHLWHVSSRPAFHCIGLRPGRSDKAQKQRCDCQNANENLNGLSCSHVPFLLSVLKMTYR